METAPRELRKLKGPQGVQKPSHTQDKDKKSRAACQACYERKKRCVPAPPHRRCKFCFGENQECRPRERISRIIEENVNLKSSTPDFPKNAFNLPLPRGIDHEVPRWSAVYSMFAEVLNLIPPEDESAEQMIEEDAPSDRDEENNQQTTQTKSRHSTSEDKPGNSESNDREKTSDATNLNAPERSSNSPALKQPPSTRPYISPLDKDFMLSHSASGQFHGGLDMHEIDALLRF